MFRYLLLALLLIITPVHADFLGNLISTITGEDISPTTPISPTEDTITDARTHPLKHAAQIRVFDKRTNRRTEDTLKTTSPKTYGDITVQVKNCLRHHHQVGHHAAWFTITENLNLDKPEIPHKNSKDSSAAQPKTRQNADKNASTPPLFNGWMLSAFPGVSALEHPRYDVRIIECLR